MRLSTFFETPETREAVAPTPASSSVPSRSASATEVSARGHVALLHRDREHGVRGRDRAVAEDELERAEALAVDDLARSGRCRWCRRRPARSRAARGSCRAVPCSSFPLRLRKPASPRASERVGRRDYANFISLIASKCVIPPPKRRRKLNFVTPFEGDVVADERRAGAVHDRVAALEVAERDAVAVRGDRRHVVVDLHRVAERRPPKARADPAATGSTGRCRPSSGALAERGVAHEPHRAGAVLRLQRVVQVDQLVAGVGRGEAPEAPEAM
jgi:hypothetical protein